MALDSRFRGNDGKKCGNEGVQGLNSGLRMDGGVLDPRSLISDARLRLRENAVI
ncbi:MAG: hypothetical protein LBP90_00450 [Burkholderiales bacterium]|nr:hypothetical protein [Burkholderiales bacterium]